MSDTKMLELCSKHIEVAEDAMILAEEMLRRFNDKRFSKTPAYRVVVSFIVSKSYLTSKAILKLCKLGYTADAYCLLRTLFENACNMRYILKEDSSLRGERFIEYGDVERLRLDEQMKETGIQDKTIEIGIMQAIVNLKEKKEEFVKKYNITSERKELHGWSGLSMKRHAKEAGLQREYAAIYGELSAFLHGNERSSAAYIQKAGSNIVLKTEPDFFRLDQCLMFMCIFMHYILEAYNKEFGLELEEEVNGMRQVTYSLKSVDDK